MWRVSDGSRQRREGGESWGPTLDLLSAHEARPLSLSRRYALTGKEVQQILKQRLIKVDGKVKTDTTYPAGFMDVVQIEKTDEHFRLVYDSKGRFVVHRIQKEEAEYKLCQVRKLAVGKGGVPYVTTHDGRTLRYPDPDVKVMGGTYAAVHACREDCQAPCGGAEAHAHSCLPCHAMPCLA